MFQKNNATHKRFIMIFLLIVFYFFSISVAFSAEVKLRSFIIDIDVGIDDVIAMFYFLQQKNINVKAILVDGNGNAHALPATRNVLNLLQLVKKSEIPVAYGRDKSLLGNHHFPESVFQESDTLAHTPLKFSSQPLPKQHAVDLLLETLHRA